MYNLNVLHVINKGDPLLRGSSPNCFANIHFCCQKSFSEGLPHTAPLIDECFQLIDDPFFSQQFFHVSAFRQVMDLRFREVILKFRLVADVFKHGERFRNRVGLWLYWFLLV